MIELRRKTLFYWIKKLIKRKIKLYSKVFLLLRKSLLAKQFSLFQRR